MLEEQYSSKSTLVLVFVFVFVFVFMNVPKMFQLQQNVKDEIIFIYY